jgi:hypothetical protein
MFGLDERRSAPAGSFLTMNVGGKRVMTRHVTDFPPFTLMPENRAPHAHFAA